MTSLVLVALQLSLIAAIVLPYGAAAWTIAGSLLVGAGIALGAWALSANRPGNFNIRPEPKAGATLVTGGPYRLVRHPMYLAVLVGMLGFCVSYGGPWRWAALVALAVVLLVKAGIEERTLTAHHPGYADYARSRKRIVPFVW
jgi:protein-S-isoprenylcysteine O-methyltransferase Ste14